MEGLHLELPESFNMVYTWNILLQGIYIRYIPAIFQEKDFQMKSLCINSNMYMRICICLWCVIQYTEWSVSTWGLKPHKIYNKIVEYVRYIPCICMVHTWVPLFLICLLFTKTKMKLPPQLRSSMYRLLITKAGGQVIAHQKA